MICCDTCPYSPTCEEEDDFLAEISGLYDDEDATIYREPEGGYMETAP